MEQTLKMISVNIKRERENRGWTQENLAEASGLSISFINKLENEQKSIGMKSLIRILDALEVSSEIIIPSINYDNNNIECISEFADLTKALDEDEVECIMQIVRYNIKLLKQLIHKKIK